MPEPTTLLFAFLALAALAAILGLFAWWDGRQAAKTLTDIAVRLASLEARGDGTERAIREEMKALRAESEDRSRNLRMELGQGIAGGHEATQTRMTALSQTLEDRFTAFETLQKSDAAALRTDLGDNMKRSDEHTQKASDALAETQRERLEAMRTALAELTARLEGQQKQFGDRLGNALTEMTQKLQALMDANDARQTQLRDTLNQNLETLRKGNEDKLEQMRLTVDEKLQGTLEKRLGESFLIVSERLDKVHQGLGEMQTLATGVGDLKRVLTNVKSRGGWAEVQLGALLENMLGPEQYIRNARIKPKTQEVVEFAIRMPGGDDGVAVLLPIDAKFPMEDYERLLKAQERGEPHEVELAAVALANAVRREAKGIADRYIDPPASTDFAIMYLPTEGLFAEVIRRDDLLTELQQRYKVTVAGPTTLTAFLTSLQMGFRTLAVQKRSSEVWRVLGEAKAEFEKYGQVWDKLQKQLATVQNTVTEAGKRTNALSRRLRSVESIETVSAASDLLTAADIDDDPAELDAQPKIA